MSECPNVRARPRKFGKPLAQPLGLRHCTLNGTHLRHNFLRIDIENCVLLFKDHSISQGSIVTWCFNTGRVPRALLPQLAMACKDSQRDWRLTTSRE
jgi:hypothetical protein